MKLTKAERDARNLALVTRGFDPDQQARARRSKTARTAPKPLQATSEKRMGEAPSPGFEASKGRSYPNYTRAWLVDEEKGTQYSFPWAGGP